LQGRSVPTDGSQMQNADKTGVSCDLCHRLVDPIPHPENPAEDAAILAGLELPPNTFGTGMMVVDPTGARRGPFVDADSGHPILVSPFHREAALCGTCHDVSNPAFEKDANGHYVPNALNAPATSFFAHVIAPVERTYSEWFHSAYNTPQGVYGPEFGGNKAYVASCQDCHMRDITGQGCNTDPPVRTDLPLHDMTGGSTWLPGLLPALYPSKVDEMAIAAGIERARYLLQNAADMAAVQAGRTLSVTVTNQTGHKLPTGYPEGRRMWLNVQFYDAAQNLVGESGAYDPATGVLAHDEEVKIYEIEPATSGIPGLPDGTLFHFVLNNMVLKDNRIPPRGFANATFADFGGAPVGITYADGQYWDVTDYEIPAAATGATVTLYYQSASKEFIEFLRNANTTNAKGHEMYDLWANNGKCPPELMTQVQISIEPPLPGDFDDDGYVDFADFTALVACLTGPAVPLASECAPADLEFDADADLADFAAFQRAFTGPDAVPPAAPTGLTATAGDALVTLEWDDNLELDLAGYHVYRSVTAGGPYDPLNVALVADSAYTDVTAQNGTTYYYVVTAVDTRGNESADSNEASATPELNALMHVHALVTSVDDQGGGSKYGVAHVTIVDVGGNPVPAATVTGTFTGDFSGIRSAVTNGAGVAEVRIGPKQGRTNFSFCVDDVTHSFFVYDPAANVLTCDAYP
jgi:hypothetical protein